MTEEAPRQSTPGDIVTLDNQQQVVDVVVSTIFKLWEAVNQLTRLRSTLPRRYRVTIFGSARVPNTHWVYQAVRDLSAELTRMGCDIVTGDGPGILPIIRRHHAAWLKARQGGEGA